MLFNIRVVSCTGGMTPWFMYIVCVVIVVIIVDRNPLWNCCRQRREKNNGTLNVRGLTKLGYPAYLTVKCVDAPG
jgi:hypothetical protein